EKRSTRSSVSGGPKYWAIASTARRNSSLSAQGRTSKAIGGSLELLERCVVEHEPALGTVVREAHRNDTFRFDSHHNSLAERLVTHVVAGRKRRHVCTRPDLALLRRAVVRPRRGLQAISVDVRFGELVEEPRGEVVRA